MEASTSERSQGATEQGEERGEASRDVEWGGRSYRVENEAGAGGRRGGGA